MEALFLSLALLFSGITVTENHQVCDYNTAIQGEYHIDTNHIIVCSNNIHQGNKDIVLKHEVIHAIHENFGMVEPNILLPQWVFTPLVDRMPKGEVLSVLTIYDYPQQELEARILSKLPGHAVGFLLLYSELYQHL